MGQGHRGDPEFLQGAFIQEGVSPTPGVIIAACTLGDDDEAPTSRLGIRVEGGWLDFDVPGEALLSVDATDKGWAYALAESGTVVRFNWKRPRTQKALRDSRELFPNAATEDLGPLRRLRVLGGAVLSAGSCGQVYELRDDTPVSLPRLSVDGDDVTIEDFAGPSRNDFLAVTSEGHVARFDGKRWHPVQLPLTTSFSGICSLGAAGYALCGEDGAVLVGSGTQWRVIKPLRTRPSYWGIATHQQRVYVASETGIDTVEGDRIKRLTIPKAKALQFTLLRSAQDGVWSFADHTIGCVSEGTWHTLVTAPATES